MFTCESVGAECVGAASVFASAQAAAVTPTTPYSSARSIPGDLSVLGLAPHTPSLGRLLANSATTQRTPCACRRRQNIVVARITRPGDKSRQRRPAGICFHCRALFSRPCSSSGAAVVTMHGSVCFSDRCVTGRRARCTSAATYSTSSAAATQQPKTTATPPAVLCTACAAVATCAQHACRRVTIARHCSAGSTCHEEDVGGDDERGDGPCDARQARARHVRAHQLRVGAKLEQWHQRERQLHR